MFHAMLFPVRWGDQVTLRLHVSPDSCNHRLGLPFFHLQKNRREILLFPIQISLEPQRPLREPVSRFAQEFMSQLSIGSIMRARIVA
jgi:hypothetical protein